MIATTKLSNLQLDLLKMFSFEIDDTQLIEIRSILTNYFAQKATSEMDKSWIENNWTNDTMEKWANEHLRTSNKN